MDTTEIVVAVFIVVILGFAGVCLYGILAPGYMVKKGRKVNARVISCEKRIIEMGEDTGVIYEVTVDFKGRYGETVIKTFQSEEPVRERKVIASRYVDNNGRFMPNAEEAAKENGGLWLVMGVLAVILGIVLSAASLQDENGNFPDWYVMGWGYVISFLFMGIGFLGMKHKIQNGKKQHDMQVLEGRQVDFIVRKGHEDGTDTYLPVYEYEVAGVSYQYRGKVSGSGKKYRQIGRKVHMVRNCKTGAVVCREEEWSMTSIFLIFGITGAAVFCMLLAVSTGIL